MQRFLSSLLLFGLATLLAKPVSALNANYDYKLVALGGQTIDGYQLTNAFGSPICINDAGLIVFTGTFQTSPGNVSSVLFTPYRAIIKAGDVIDGQTLLSPGSCSVNNSGDILFVSGLSSGQEGLFKIRELGAGHIVAQTGTSIGGLKVTSFLNSAINDNDRIVFAALYGIRGSEIGLFTPKEPLVVNGSVIGPYTVHGIDPMFALSSKHLFVHATSAQVGEGIFTLHELLAQQGGTISGYQLEPTGSSTFGYLAASSGDKVVFGATFNGGAGIFNPHSILALFPGDLLPPTAAINNSGTIAYGGANGIVVNGQSLFDFFDSVEGHIANGLSLPPAINNRGDIVFEADFEDGTQGIILATPKH